MDTDADRFMERMAGPAPEETNSRGRTLLRGSRVRLKPKPGGDILDRFLADRIAVVEGLDEDEAGIVHVAVIIEDDPGRDFGDARQPAHRFFFKPDELEPVDTERKETRRVLVAGIGNVFFGDDGFGVEVVRRLLEGPLPPGVDAVDFGIRGMDLAYALGRPYDAAILVDAVPWGMKPGSVFVIEPEENSSCTFPDGHRMDPMAVLGLAGRLGSLPSQILIVGCEPKPVSDTDDLSVGLSAPVAAAVGKAADTVIELANRLLAGGKT